MQLSPKAVLALPTSLDRGGEDKIGALSTNFSKQVKQAYKNMLITLQALNAKPNQVTKITTYVVG